MQKMTIGVVVAVLLGGFTVAAAQLPPNIVADRELVRAERLISEGDHSGALEAMNGIVALQSEFNLTLPDAFHFKYAEVALAAGRFEGALDAVTQYLVDVGREGLFYTEALALLDRIEQMQLRAAALLVEIQNKTCAYPSQGADCWLEFDNQPGCYVWISGKRADITATWTGACVGGLVWGMGTITWAWNSGQSTRKETGRFQDGQKHGDWVERGGRGGVVYEGPYVEGQRHGHWVERLPFSVYEGPYVEGQRHGHWVKRYDDGRIWKGPYVEGQRHGHWVERYTDGHVTSSQFVNGKKQKK